MSASNAPSISAPSVYDRRTGTGITIQITRESPPMGYAAFIWRRVSGMVTPNPITEGLFPGTSTPVTAPDSAITGNGSITVEAHAVNYFIGSGSTQHWSPLSSTTIQATSFPPNTPSNLQPRGQQNRREPIVVSWQNNPNPQGGDAIIESEVIVAQAADGTTVFPGVIVPGAAATYTIPANTIPANWDTAFILVRSRGGNNSGWSEFAVASFPVVTINPPGQAVITTPGANSTQNPTRQIRVTWNHVPPASGEPDAQESSDLQYRTALSNVPVSSWIAVNDIRGNRYDFPPDTFEITPAYNQIHFAVRTVGRRGGAGELSAFRTANLRLQPSLAPSWIRPAEPNERRNPIRDIEFRWAHTPNPDDSDAQVDARIEFFHNTGSFIPSQDLTEAHWESGLGFNTGGANSFVLPGDTFDISNLTARSYLRCRVRTQTQRNDWGANSAVRTVILHLDPPLAPENVDVMTRYPNPRGIIRVGWTHVPNPVERDDQQTDSRVRARQGTGAWSTFSGGVLNMAEIPAGTFTLGEGLVRYQAQTRSQNNGWGAWSPERSFAIMSTPPHPPILTHPPSMPPGNHVPATRGVNLQVAYNSPFDVFPSRFDFEYRFTGDSVPTLVSTESQDGRPAAVTVTTRAVPEQSRLEWRAKAYGEAGDASDWSETSTAFIIGIPQTPVVTNVTNSGRPEITFSALNVSAWEIEIRDIDIVPGDVDGDGQIALFDSAQILQFVDGLREFDARQMAAADVNADGAVTIEDATLIGQYLGGHPVTLEVSPLWVEVATVYATGERAFECVFRHVAEKLIPNGVYFARVRIANEYRIWSAWSASKRFEIDVATPQAVRLTTANNLHHSAHLRFNGAGKTVFVYRAEIDSADFLRIARVENAADFHDWTGRPGTRYKYFLRVVNENFGFADSNTETAKAKFMETTIAVADTPHDVIEMRWQLGGKPTKNSSFRQDKSLTHFAGREKPVVQIGEHTARVANLAFYVSLADRDRLEELAQSAKTLILRDWRLGVIYGTITGDIATNSDGFSAHCQVSFNFTETDFPVEVEM